MESFEVGRNGGEMTCMDSKWLVRRTLRLGASIGITIRGLCTGIPNLRNKEISKRNYALRIAQDLVKWVRQNSLK